MRKMLLALILTAGCAQSVAAESEAARLAAARAYIALPVVQESLEAELALGPIYAFIEEDLKRRNLRAAMHTRVRAQIRTALSQSFEEARPDLIGLWEALMARHFTTREIEAMIRYAKSPEGASAHRKAGAYMADAQLAGAPLVERIAERTMTRVRRIAR